MNKCSELTETQKRSKLNNDKEMTDMSNEEMFAAIMGKLEKIDERLDVLGKRVGALESRLEKIDERLDALEKRVGALESKLEKIDERLDALEKRVGALEKRVGALENRLDKTDERLEALEGRIDTLEYNMNMEFQAVRTEMEFVNNSLKREIDMLNNKVDVLLFTKDVAGYDKINARLEVLEHGYQEIREKIG